MRYTYAKFVNYAGFYMGMGLNELVIPFNLCRHRITLIAGANGSGKSTLREALSPLPNDNKMFLEGMTASKELHITDGTDIYQIKIISPVNNKGERKKTEAFIAKNGEELNPNGNVSSYKDTLYSLFDLDANYVSLMTLSNEDKGLATKTPAERKKYVANIIDTVDTYNNMYKVLSKKASVLKSQLNGLSVKMKQLGDKPAIQTALQNTVNNMNLAKDRLERLINKKAEADAKVKTLDPDGKLQEKVNAISNEIMCTRDELNKASSLLSRMNINREEEEITDELIMKKKELMMRHQIDLENIDKKITDMIAGREEDLHIIEIKRQKLADVDDGVRVDELVRTINNLKTAIAQQEVILTKSGVPNGESISKQEYFTIFDTLSNIEQSLRNLTASYNHNEIEQIALYDIDTIDEHIRKIDLDRQSYVNELTDLRVKLSAVTAKKETMKILLNRPDGCNIDDCPFIESAVRIQHEDPLSQEAELTTMIDTVTDELFVIEKSLDQLRHVREGVATFKAIQDKSLNPILTKIGLFNITPEYLLQYANGDHRMFDDIRDVLSNYRDYAEQIADHDKFKNLLVKSEASLEVAKNKEAVIHTLALEIEEIDKKLQDAANQIEKLNKERSFSVNLIDNLQRYIQSGEQYLSLKNKCVELNTKIHDLDAEYVKLQDSYKEIGESLKISAEYGPAISKTKQDIAVLEQQQAMHQHNYISYQEYETDYNNYNNVYNTINVLKKYCSPGGEGIQSLYMEMYMSTTLQMCNDILQMLFRGAYKLCPYVINDKEFRIPFMNDNLIVDDISNGSSSQTSMIGMIINLVLMYQGSTKFNIPSLDEIEAALDTYNRLGLINVIYKTMDMLKIDQLLMISHSIELNMNDVDLILLKGYGDEQDKFEGANVIFDYNQL